MIHGVRGGGVCVLRADYLCVVAVVCCFLVVFFLHGVPYVLSRTSCFKRVPPKGIYPVL